jgi:hypothetical protein
VTYWTWCDNGHQYVAADYYHDWPKNLPKCPHCRKGVPPTHYADRYGGESFDWFYDARMLPVGGIAVGTAYAVRVDDVESDDIEYQLLNTSG